MANRHTFAKGMVEDAGKRIRQPLIRLKELQGMENKALLVELVMLQEQNLVLGGAVLEEVMNGHGAGWGDKTKAVVLQTVPPFAGMGGLLFLLSVMGVI